MGKKFEQKRKAKWVKQRKFSHGLITVDLYSTLHMIVKFPLVYVTRYNEKGGMDVLSFHHCKFKLYLWP